MKVLVALAASAAAIGHRAGHMSFLTGVTETGKWIPDRYATGEDDSLMHNLIAKGLAFTVDDGYDDHYKFSTADDTCKATEEACLCCM